MFVVVTNTQIGTADILADSTNIGAGVAVRLQVAGVFLDVCVESLTHRKMIDLVVDSITAVELQGKLMLVDFSEQFGIGFPQITRPLLPTLLAIEKQQRMAGIA